ncbi:MFS transporter [Actinomadura fibrosa]|uniref:MFS transporter n=1 Tax=Actinomadura fibrosa TaxID=111802 RepID=A0ABW2XWV4_9ACTN|nr:MFS transporter [Actinomadura fibrosa]
MQDFIVLYPVYAALFADAGLSAAAISSLFVIWSVAGFALELPSGVWADAFSRRRLLVAAPLLSGAGFGAWAAVPSYPVFAVGFVLWGAGSALRSGTLQALVYEELARAGAAASYARLVGRSEAAGLAGVVAASALAAPVLAVGGYAAAGVLSVAACGACAVAGWRLPESPRVTSGEPVRGTGGVASTDDASAGVGASLAAVVREGWRQVRTGPRLRRSLLVMVVLTGVGALDEYVPLLVRDAGVAGSWGPLLVLMVVTGDAVGGWLSGRGARWPAPVLAVGAVCLAAGSLDGRPGGLVLVAVAFGALRWSTAAADARLQEGISDGARATVTSLAGLGSEVVAVLVFAGWGLGSAWAGPGVLMAAASVPIAVVAVVLGATRTGRRPDDRRRWRAAGAHPAAADRSPADERRRGGVTSIGALGEALRRRPRSERR